MRVTQGMVTDSVIYNTQRSIRKFLEIQNSMSTGRKINTPSDDPIGTVRDLDYRGELASIDQYIKNIAQGQNWTKTYDTILADAKDLLSSAKEIAVAMSNDTYDQIARDASATEIQSIFDRLIDLGNNELEGRRIFGGFRTQAKPFAKATNGVMYRGDFGVMEYGIEPGARSAINLNGADTFLKPLTVLGQKADLNLGVAGTTRLADLHSGAGVDQTPGTFRVTDVNRNISVVINVPGATTLQDVINQGNAQLAFQGITNLTLKMGVEGNNLAFDTTENGRVSTTTQLAKLNGGNGVDISPGKIRVTNGSTVDVQVDLSGSVTLGDIITKFNTQLNAAGVANVTMGVNVAGTGLQINDTNGVPLNLAISDLSTYEQTAAGLGIAGNVAPTLVGTALQPLVHFKVEETTGTTAADLGLLAECSGDYSGDDLDARLLTTSLLSKLNNGSGLDQSQIVLWQGNSSATIDLGNPAYSTIQDVLNALNNSGLNITASINADGRGIQIANNDPSTSFTIEDLGIGKSAKEWGIYGSSDLMGSLLVLTNALRNDDQRGAAMMLDTLDKGIQHLLNQRAIVGARTQRLDNADARLTDSKLNYTKLLSDVEDADITELVTTLATYENNYQAALMASAKLIQPSLLDFLK